MKSNRLAEGRQKAWIGSQTDWHRSSADHPPVRWIHIEGWRLGRKAARRTRQVRSNPQAGWDWAEGENMTDTDPEIEYSPLCGEVNWDGLTVRVQIYRIKGGTEGWLLEVVDHTNASTVWDNLFAIDPDAYAEFYEALETEGIRSFSETPPSASLH
jgi:hypothetical protein